MIFNHLFLDIYLSLQLIMFHFCFAFNSAKVAESDVSANFSRIIPDFAGRQCSSGFGESRHKPVERRSAPADQRIVLLLK